MALAFVAEQLHASPAALRDYGARSQTRTEHLQQIQRYLGFRDATREDFSTSADWLLTRALEHDKPSLLFQLACEQLHAEKIIRLGVTRIERLVMETRERGHRHECAEIGTERCLASPGTGYTPLILTIWRWLFSAHSIYLDHLCPFRQP